MMGLTVTLMIASSFVSSYFLLETQPLYQTGIVRYGYRDPTFVQVLPVISASVSFLCLRPSSKPLPACLLPHRNSNQHAQMNYVRLLL